MKTYLKSVVFLMCIVCSNAFMVHKEHCYKQTVSSAKISLMDFEKYRLTNEQRERVRMIIVQLVDKGMGKDCAYLIAHEYIQDVLNEREARKRANCARTQREQRNAMGRRMYYSLSSHTYN